LIASCWTDLQAADFQANASQIVRHSLLPSVPPDQTLTLDYFVAKRELGYAGFSIRSTSLTTQFTDYAHIQSMTVFIWTIQTPTEISSALDINVDGIITNDPNGVTSLVVQQLYPSKYKFFVILSTHISVNPTPPPQSLTTGDVVAIGFGTATIGFVGGLTVMGLHNWWKHKKNNSYTEIENK
jgi:hypothetical protein